jgi:hypothetical protein
MQPNQSDPTETKNGDGFSKSQHDSYRIRKGFAWILIAMATTLLVVDGALLRQNRNFRRVLDTQVQSLEPHVGANVPALEGMDLGGNRIVAAYDDSRKTALFVFSTECSICTKNWPTWEALAKGLDRRSIRVIYANLSTKLTSDYVNQHGLEDALVFAELDPKVTVAYNLGLTPQVLLISPAGKIERLWPGMLKESGLSDMKRALNVNDSNSPTSALLHH